MNFALALDFTCTVILCAAFMAALVAATMFGCLSVTKYPKTSAMIGIVAVSLCAWRVLF